MKRMVGSIIGSRSVLGIRVKREEVPFCNIRFKSKAQRLQAFDKWVQRVIAQPGVKKLFNQLRIMKEITQARSILLAGILLTLNSWFLDGSLRPILSWGL